ncbi:MAG TPA: SGNH/GDSL hydrolase family protein [Myxococcales bacterium]|jgi:hypothetical protein
MGGGHVALLGDSSIDNGRYTGGEPDVASHLRALLPLGWRATLLARDGSTTNDFAPQVEKIPADASHLVVSLGGNDLLLVSDLLAKSVSSTTVALELFADRCERFERNYRKAIEPLLALGRELTVCTVYEGSFPAPQAGVTRTALRIFNDAILRFAFEAGLGAIEMRAVCTERSDFANPIEPSGPGGRKIARAVAQAVGALPSPRTSRVFVLR